MSALLEPDLLHTVFSFLDARRLSNATRACGTWGELIQAHNGMLWRKLLAVLWNEQNEQALQSSNFKMAANQESAVRWLDLIQLVVRLPSTLDPERLHPTANLHLSSPNVCVFVGSSEELGVDRVVLHCYCGAQLQLPTQLLLPAVVVCRFVVEGAVAVALVSSVYYFEVYISESDSEGNPHKWDQECDEMVSIGFVPPQYQTLGAQPGWKRGSFGYHGDDGHKFAGSGTGAPFGPRYSVGDTVGAGIDYMRQMIFFTKNGENLGEAFVVAEGALDSLLPAVGVDTHSSLKFNFGASLYNFDLAAYEATKWQLDRHSFVQEKVAVMGYKRELKAFREHIEEVIHIQVSEEDEDDEESWGDELEFDLDDGEFSDNGGGEPDL